MKKSRFQYPNALFCDERLPKTAKIVGAALYAHRNALGLCRKSYTELAKISGCAPETVRQGVRLLADAGYLSVSRTYRYSGEKGAVLYGKNEYVCNLNLLAKGYTLIDREIFREEMTAAQRLVYIALYVAAGNRRRAFPSIRKLQSLTGCARSTVCKALGRLRTLPSLVVRLCRKLNGAFAATSYFFATVLARPAREPHTGAPAAPAAPVAAFAAPQASHRTSWPQRVVRGILALRQRIMSFFSGGSPKFRKLC